MKSHLFNSYKNDINRFSIFLIKKNYLDKCFFKILELEKYSNKNLVKTVFIFMKTT